ncbi:MAG: hypothetical protein QOD31_2300 [Pseudonocardiales bacterium]|jgi:hypothetical protein|nr:hypothetical protein [Pseudonocardiales bacterium]
MTTRTRFGLLIAALLVAAVAVGGVFAIRAALKTSPFAVHGCTVDRYDLDTSQAAVASTMVGVVTRRQLPERAAVLVLAAALQESKLRNLALGDGDRDSVGVLQQRPSQGWGTEQQLSDLRFATGAFLDALVKVPNWQKEDLAVAIQAVQISADGSAYAQHEAEAQALSNALTGAVQGGITCSFDKPTQVAPVATVVTQVVRDLPVTAPTTTPSTVSVPGARWQTAAWFVANADRLGIDKVAYSGKQWTRANGWKSATAPATAVVATMYQR